MSQTYYPPSPALLPKKLTALTPSYQLKAFLAVLSILLFFVLYSALVTCLGYLAYHALAYDMGDVNKATILLKVGAVAGSVMLFVFTLKFIFKLKNPVITNRIKLKKKDNPELWGFVNQICKDTGAHKPKAIYVDPDVNAYVSYANMWLSLFLPVRKELTIGLGLVSCINFSEFKAVISHEFGHFAQRSMKIGSYIISANTIIHDMIFSRDKWDDLLAQWRASDIRLSAAAWVITPVIWMIRQILNLFYQFLNIMYSSLSREMEFNADKVAVSTSGSDSIISALWKLDSGAENWNNTVNNAYMASQKQLFSKNLYHHNLLAVDRNSEKQKNQLNSLPEDKRGGRQFFSSSENSGVSMYASHPPNDKREENAKVPYIQCEVDDRSPWLLFALKDELQEEMTTLIYQIYFNKKADQFIDYHEFEVFVKEESKGKDLLEEYNNTFENRFLNIDEINKVEEKANELEVPGKEDIDRLKDELKKLMEPVNEIEKEMEKVQQIADGTIKEKKYVIHGISYSKDKLQNAFNYLLGQREKLFNETFKEWDLTFCASHLALAKEAGTYTNLINLYKQHAAISRVYKMLAGTKNIIFDDLSQLQSRDDVEQFEVANFGERVNNNVQDLNKSIDLLNGITFVKLPNIDNIADLKNAIVEGGEFKQAKGNMFENGGFNQVVNTIEMGINHCQRIDQKSIGAILSFHKDLEKQFETTHNVVE